MANPQDLTEWYGTVTEFYDYCADRGYTIPGAAPPPTTPAVSEFIAFTARATAGQSFGTVRTLMRFDTALTNEGGYWDDANDAFSPPAGIYQFNLALCCTATANNSNVTLYLFKNGVELTRATDVGSQNGDLMTATIAFSAESVAGDKFEAYMQGDRTMVVIGQASGFTAALFNLPGAAARSTQQSAEQDEAAQEALLRASTYIDAAYSDQWIGLRTYGRNQPRDWPRSGAYDSEGHGIDKDEIPIEVRHATYECGLREMANPGSLQPDVTAGQIKERVRVGSVEVAYATRYGIEGQSPTLTILDGILQPLLGGLAGGGLANALVGRGVRSN